ncbi:MAG: glycosyltransferase family 2 protein [Bacteroidota bacterium]|jgi:glycosyltransferase involved in cell wall biosynthesis|nr:glycosyltransferase family 2 protein [Bacteroidota bacterium]
MISKRSNIPGKVFVIIPAYNESSVVRSTLKKICAEKYEIVLVDDGSTDNLQNSITGISVHYLRHEFNLGQGAALQTGIEYALNNGAEFLVTFDADGQHSANEIEMMLNFISSNNLDIVYGSRFLKNGKTNISLFRRLTIQLAIFINFIFTGVLLTDAHNGFRIFTRKFAENLYLTENKMAHASEFLFYTIKNKFNYAELPVTILYSEYSKKKGQKFFYSFKILQDLIFYKIFK